MFFNFRQEIYPRKLKTSYLDVNFGGNNRIDPTEDEVNT